jgi:TrmH family RNA methyltransferase
LSVPTRRRPLYNHSLLTASQRDRISVVLVSPRNPLNIGAAARAMANFGFSRLSVVAPYEPHWREAKSAIGAEDLLQKARRTESLSEAVADCALVLGTGSLARRKPEQPVVPLPVLAPIVLAALRPRIRVALVFGPEKHGLTRSDLALCHSLVEIPTHPCQPSMNLAQAVAVCLYELTAPRKLTAASPAPSAILGAPGPGSPATRLSRRGGGPSPLGIGEGTSPDIGLPATSGPPATAADLDLLATVIEQTLAAANDSPAAMHNANRRHLDLLLRRLSFNRGDARRAMGVFRRILWRLQHQSGTR